MSHVYIKDENGFELALKDLSGQAVLVFDAEGVDLGRNGSLTVATISGLSENATIYVIDVQLLGGDKVFSKSDPSLSQLLEGDTPVVMFDCRQDSDALFHNFSVNLSNVKDVQVLEQAVRIFNGDAPPKKCPYVVEGDIPLLHGMSVVSQRLGIDSPSKMPAPHRYDTKVWEKRPLDPKSIEYAAADVRLIRDMNTKAWNSIRKKLSTSNARWCNFWSKLEDAFNAHSKRYVEMYRDREQGQKRHPSPLFMLSKSEKNLILEERPIIDDTELPSDHPRRQPESKLKGKQKWDSAVQLLLTKRISNRVQAYNDVMFVLQHDDWYTDEGKKEIRRLAQDFPFTPNQQSKIRKPPALEREEDYDYDCYYSSDDGYGYGW